MPLPVRLPDLEHWKAQVKCQAGCPVSTDAGRYVQLIAEGRDEEAFLVARAPNPFASICGRVCAAPCEDACRRGAIDAPVSIRALKRFVTEQYGVESTRPDTQDRLAESPIEQGNRYAGHMPLTFHRVSPAASSRPRRKVAIVGSGPAGMAAAHDLAVMGYDVTVLESASEPGGMVRFGIPEYRLPRTVIRAEIDKITALGVDLRLNTPVTPEYDLAALRREGFDAVFLSVGVSTGRDLQVPGVELDGVVKAIDYLLNVNRGYRVQLGNRVVVIGGGFVAFDAARTALRGTPADQEHERADLAAESDARVKEAFDSARSALRAGARDVTVVSLESFDEMPVLRTTQGHEEFEEASREGVRFVTRRGPLRFVGNGRLSAVELRAVTSVFDANGRFAPTYADGDVMTIDADACILAIGQRADLSFLKPEDGVELTPGGTIRIDQATLATSAPGRVRRRRCRLRPAQPHRGRGQRQARGAVHSCLPEPRDRVDRTPPGDREAPDVPLPHDRGLRAVRSEGPADARHRPAHGDQRGRNRLRPRRGGRTGGPMPRLPRADDLRPRALRPVQPLRRHLPRALPRDRPVREPRPRRRHARRARVACAGVGHAPLGHGEGRRAVHPLRAVRHPLPDRRDDDGEVHDHGTPRAVQHASGRRRCANAGGNDMSDANAPQHSDRRDFLLKLGAGAGFVAITAQAGASLRSLVPNVTYDAPTTVKVGLPEEFPDGLKFLPDERLFVFRNGRTFHAISAVCTHLGCTVRAEALARPEEQTVEGQTLRLTHRFMCPCHGSRYSGDGSNVSGPAPTPLAWYRLTVSPDDGQLVVDLADEVDHSFRLTLS